MVIFILLFNLWIWKIFNINILIGIVVIIETFLIWYGIKSGKKVFYTLSVLFLIICMSIQWKTSSINSLTFINENEKLRQQLRLNAYPQVKFNLGSKTIYIPIANWLEQRKETFTFYKLKSNISEIADINLFFFANHPRERVGVIEQEKFPYILFPLFVIGLYELVKNNKKYAILLIFPFILNSIIGNSNTAGPFSLFPFFVVSIALGANILMKNKKLVIPGLILFFLVFIQALAYAKY